MVKVHVKVSQDLVAESNCVAVRWGGEQLEANWQSVGNELDSVGSVGEPSRLWGSLKHIEYAELANKAIFGTPLWLETECWEVCAS
jgi:hypothetical protein